MTYLDAILLLCFRLFNGDRSRSAIFHLISGKKTSQTIQDAHLYGAHDFFQIYPHLSRKSFDQSCERLIMNKYLIEFQEQRWRVSEDGENALDAYFKNHPFPFYLKGWLYHDRATIFWKRLLLLSQSLSNYIHQENRFFPVQRDPDIQHWVKHTFLNWKDDRRKNTKKLYLELTKIFMKNKFPDHPDYIVQQMTGFQLIGQTPRQLADHFKTDESEVHIRFLNTLHYILTEIQDKNTYPILNSIQKDITQKEFVLTVSTEKTLRYIQQFYTIEKIAQIRNLKTSTIEDHIIEIALMVQTFSIEPYVELSLQDEIWLAANSIRNKRMKEIKDLVPRASFFQIRLVLVSKGRTDNKWKIPYLNTLDSGLSERVKKKSSKV
ncbi:helix-turn-helix domain-containing protein [Jeotgalibacillus campisalis]|uniref:Helicase Helix-turn-helix domain-containing protein n=1 Tax=Jeotgalibacillus campisalis TaxID=220754 RepID=A0A0C2VGV1_9BACL|nr:helix-turn-helix domain-containing protein [Jeotgalibacillus campisalis]KIL48097.1 hypothetical protein KR50_22640 [Jeotgalibacillus campisalis]